jgi:hypothetical protein
VRNSTVLFVLIGILAFGGPALARDVYMQKQTADQLKALCTKVGGSFTQDSSGYNCGTDCHGHPGTACNVYCQPGKRCVAQVIMGRRFHSIENALKVPERHHR